MLIMRFSWTPLGIHPLSGQRVVLAVFIVNRGELADAQLA